jgi:hypothetical protein
MNSSEISSALKRERSLMEDFLCMSEEQLILLADKNLDGMETLLQRRAELMKQLTAIESDLGDWIASLHEDRFVTRSTKDELYSIKEEIARMANRVLTVDAQTHALLDLIKQRARAQLQNIDQGKRTLNGYSSGISTVSRLRMKG